MIRGSYLIRVWRHQSRLNAIKLADKRYIERSEYHDAEAQV